MEHIYKITGMTCGGCARQVEEGLRSVNGVRNALVQLEKHRAILETDRAISPMELQAALPTNYALSPLGDEANTVDGARPTAHTKLERLRPLFLLFLYLFTAVFFMHYRHWDGTAAMLDFMGLFYIVFSFFKLLDLQGFSLSFAMYDPLAKGVPFYGKAYPFIEVLLGLMFLARIQIVVALVVTMVVLGSTTFGVVRTLLDKKRIRCACLGTALNLPMTEATFIENAIMLVMAGILLVQIAV